MTGHEFTGEANTFVEESEMETTLQVLSVGLGPNNRGEFGPDGLSEERQADITAANADPQYEKTPTNLWKCVDSRTDDDEEAAVDAETLEADPQIGGSLPVSELAAKYMSDDDAEPVSVETVAIVKAALGDGYGIAMHGANGNKAGCAANADQKDVLLYGAENVDIVAPTVLVLAEKLGIAHLIEPKDVTDSIAKGKERADDAALWDLTPEARVALAVKHGAQYADLNGKHHEKRAKVMLKDTAHAKAKFNKNMSDDEATIHEFAVALGAYKAMTWARATKHGVSERDAALKVMRVVAFNVALTKFLSTESMQVDIVS